MKSNLTICFCFTDCVFGMCLKSHRQTDGHLDFLSMSPFRSFIILFKIQVYDAIWGNLCERCKICVCACVCVCIFFFLREGVLFQHHILKRLSFSHWTDSTPLSKISWLCLCGSFQNSPFCFIDLHVYSFTNITPSWLLEFYSKSWSPLTLFFSFNIWGLLPLQIHLESVFQYLQNNFLGFRLGLHWIYRASWEEKTSKSYWVFLSKNMEYLFT